MKRWLLLGAVLLLPAFVLAACGGGGDGGGQGTAAGTPAGTSSGNEVKVDLAQQNDSGESGTATLTAMSGSKTRVVLELKNPTTDSQPAHIHRGSCDNLDPNPLYGLLNVMQGRSETVVDQPLSKLTAGGLAINVHQSNANLNRYVACGNVPGGDAGNAPGDDGNGYGSGY